MKSNQTLSVMLIGLIVILSTIALQVMDLPSPFLIALVISPIPLILGIELSKQNYPIVPLLSLFVIITVPIVRIVAPGNIPIYLPDILIGVALVNLLLSKRGFIVRDEKLKLIWILLFLYWIPSTIINYFSEGLATNILLETTYVLLRQLILISFVFIIIAEINTHQKLRYLMWILLAAMFVSGLIAFVQSILPPDHPIILQLDALHPLDLNKSQVYYINRGDGVRARGLVGNVNGLTFVLSTQTIIGLSILMSDEFKKYRLWQMIATFFAFIGTLVTYSRSGYLALGLGIFVLVVQKKRFRIQYAILGAVIILAIFFTTERFSFFNFNRIDYSFNALLDPSIEYGEAQRLDVPKRIYEFVVSNPVHVVVGYGEASADLISRGLISSDFYSSFVNEHNMIAAVILRRGLVSGILFLAVYCLCFIRLFEPLENHKKNEHRYLWLIQGARASIISFIPILLFTHAPISVFSILPYTFFIFGFFMIAYRFAHSDQEFS